MDRTVVDLNIAHFKRLLATEIDPATRQTIERLLAEEEAKLARVLASGRRRRPNPYHAMAANELD